MEASQKNLENIFLKKAICIYNNPKIQTLGWDNFAKEAERLAIEHDNWLNTNHDEDISIFNTIKITNTHKIKKYDINYEDINSNKRNPNK